MRIGEAFPSKYLKASDIEEMEDEQLTITISDVKQERIGQGSDAQDKLVIYSEETEKGFVVNKTNALTIAAALGTDETDDWEGRRITLISMMVQGPNGPTPGIRVKKKAAKPAATASAAPASGPGKAVPMGAGKPKAAPVVVAAEAEDDEATDDDLPF